MTNLKIFSDKKFKSELLSKKLAPEDPVELRKQFICDEVKKVDENQRIVDFVISTGAVDRMGDTVSVDGWDLKNYKKNPVVLFAHDSSSPPIAKATNIRSENGKLKATAQFMSEDMSPFAYSIFRMYIEGFMRATSVGFQPREWSFVEDDSRPMGIDFKRQELLEFSAVPIPANPEALIEARSKGIDTMPLKAWAEQVLDEWGDHKGLSLPRKSIEALRKHADEKSATSFVVPQDVQDDILSKNLNLVKGTAMAETKTEGEEQEATTGTVTIKLDTAQIVEDLADEFGVSAEQVKELLQKQAEEAAESGDEEAEEANDSADSEDGVLDVEGKEADETVEKSEDEADSEIENKLDSEEKEENSLDEDEISGKNDKEFGNVKDKLAEMTALADDIMDNLETSGESVKSTRSGRRQLKEAKIVLEEVLELLNGLLEVQKDEVDVEKSAEDVPNVVQADAESEQEYDIYFEEESGSKEQVSEGEVSEEEVLEILKEVLPQFTTELVNKELNKLRGKLD